jgi:hypothetical protein
VRAAVDLRDTIKNTSCVVQPCFTLAYRPPTVSQRRAEVYHVNSEIAVGQTEMLDEFSKKGVSPITPSAHEPDSFC